MNEIIPLVPTVKSPSNWGYFTEYFTERLTTPEQLTADIKQGISTAFEWVPYIFSSAGVPVEYETECRDDFRAGRLKVVAGEVDPDHQATLLYRPEYDLAITEERSKVSLVGAVVLNPSSVFKISDQLIHITYAGTPEERSITHGYATEALTLVGLGHYLNVLASHRQKPSDRRNRILSIARAHGAPQLRDVNEFPLHESLVGALLGGRLYNEWLQRRFIMIEAGEFADEVKDKLTSMLISLETWSDRDLLSYALTQSLSIDEVSKLLD